MGLFFPLGKGWLIYLQSANQRGCQRPLLSKQKSVESFQKHEKIWQTQLEAGWRSQKDTDKPRSLAFSTPLVTGESSSLHTACFPGISPSAPILKSSSSNFLIWLPGLFFVWLSPPGRAAPGSARPGPAPAGRPCRAPGEPRPCPCKEQLPGRAGRAPAGAPSVPRPAAASAPSEGARPQLPEPPRLRLQTAGSETKENEAMKFQCKNSEIPVVFSIVL